MSASLLLIALVALVCSWLLLAVVSCPWLPASTMHICNPACIAVGVPPRVVVVALVVVQPAADARSRRTRRIACEHDASKLFALALGWSGVLEPFLFALSWMGLRVASHCSFKLRLVARCCSLLADPSSSRQILVAARNRC